jgi:Arc/MetJ family transcription regulator
MSLWDDNLRVLKEQYAGLAGLLEAGGGAGAEILPAQTGLPTLRVQGVYIHSPRDPEREAGRLVEAALGTDGGGRAADKRLPVIVLGFGLGYTAEAAALTGRTVIMVERRVEVLRAAFQARDLRGLLGRPVIFASDGDPAAITSALALAGAGGECGNWPIIRNRALIELDAAWYAEVERHIRLWFSKDAVNAATLKRFGKRWTRNLAANCGAIRDLPGTGLLADGLGVRSGEAAIPVFLAAAGPSLDEVVPYLKAIAARAVVIAVDTALRVFRRAGVEPDFAVVVDGQYWNSRHLDRAVPPSCTLIAESGVYPSVLRAPFARAFLCSSLFPLGRFIEDRVEAKGALGAGGSVATTAWDFARLLCPQAIWIAGLDLAFPSLKTHFRGAFFEDRVNAESTRLVPAETCSVRALRDGFPFAARQASGGAVLTDRRLSLYAAWFENRLRRYPDPPSLSLSPHGLAIAGLKAAPIEALLALEARRAMIDARLGALFASVQMRHDEAAPLRAARYDAALGALTRGLDAVRALTARATGTAEALLGDLAAGRTVPESRRRAALKTLDETALAIAASEVKEAAGFLFERAPGDTVLPAAGMEKAEEAALTRYLRSSVSLYRSLTEAVQYTIFTLRKR